MKNKTSNTVDKWMKRMSDKPTLLRVGPWLLKQDTSDTRVWINELNKKYKAKRERLVGGHWVLESQLLCTQWEVAAS